MSFNDFIFSTNRRHRFLRHLFFWLSWWLYYGMMHAINPFGKEEIMYLRNIPFTLTESLLQLFPHILLTYSLLYLILPELAMKKKYLQAILAFAVIWAICGYITLYMVLNVHPVVLKAILPERFLVNTSRPPQVSTFMAMMSNYKGAMSIAGVAFGLKFVKNWYLKEQRNSQLQKENIEARLQLLTAQVHPHFLFNTLNNIYSRAEKESPGSAAMLMALADLLRYVLYEGNQEKVPLEKELNMLLEYIHLEKSRYGNNLDIHYDIQGNAAAVQIAPLLLLPFLENCFKHGTSTMIENPWIILTAEIKDTLLQVKLMNGKPPAGKKRTQYHGIGINNVKKRLELLYPDRHELEILDDEEVYIVNLKLELEKIPANDVVSLNRQNLVSYD